MSDTFSVIPQRRARCETCLDEGRIEVDGCTCLPGPVVGIPGVPHEPWCGWVPCPEGCADD